MKLCKDCRYFVLWSVSSMGAEIHRCRLGKEDKCQLDGGKKWKKVMVVSKVGGNIEL